MPLQILKRKHTPLTHPNTITQLLKAVRKGNVALAEPNRLSDLRHRRGQREHETLRSEA